MTAFARHKNTPPGPAGYFFIFRPAWRRGLGICGCLAVFWAQAASAASQAENSAFGPATAESGRLGEPSTGTRRAFDLRSPWQTRLRMAYAHPLITEMTYTALAAGPSGEVLLPGRRRFASELKFSIIADRRRLDFIPGRQDATLTMVQSPPQVREEWAWPDGLIVTRTCFQPPGCRGVGVHFQVKNQTHRPLSGVRLVAGLLDPELAGREDARGRRLENDDELIADPRAGILYLRDSEVREESWLALGWGPQGGLMSGGEPQEGDGFSPGVVRETGSLMIDLETPAWDLLPGQTHAADFWILWEYDQGGVTQNLMDLRQKSGYAGWDNRCRPATNAGWTFACRNSDLENLAGGLKAWAPWLMRQDALGVSFFASNTDTEPVTMRELAQGAAGLVLAGQGRQVRECLDAWLDQRLEVQDVASALVAAEAYLRHSQDWDWLRERSDFLEEAFNLLQHFDGNGDGLPEYSGALPAAPGAYAPFADRRAATRRTTQTLDEALNAIRAFRAGERLFARLGDQAGLLKAARCKWLADQGERTLESVFWRPELGRAGFYAGARLPWTGEVAAHRVAAAAGTLEGGIGAPEHRERVFAELWFQESWWSSQARLRTLPADDPDFDGDAATGNGQGRAAETHVVLTHALENPATATEAVRRLEQYAREIAQDPKTLGFFPAADGGGGAVEVAQYGFLETLALGLTGLRPGTDGLRVAVPRYEQDLGVSVRELPYGKTRISLRVVGAGGAGGRIWVNGEPVAEGEPIPARLLALSRTEITIRRGTPADGASTPPAGPTGNLP